MTTYQIEQFNFDFNQGTPVVTVLKKVSRSNYKNWIIQQVANGNYPEEVKYCVQNMNIILQSPQQFSGMNWKQAAEKLQRSDVNVNVGFGDQENWEAKFIELNKSYSQLQGDYRQMEHEKKLLFVQVKELKLQMISLQREKEQYLANNQNLAQQIDEYTTSTKNVIRESSMKMHEGKGLVEQLRGRIRTLEQENGKLKGRIQELEYDIKFEQQKNEEEKKQIGETDAEIAMKKGFNSTINLINQLKGNNGPALGYNAIPMLSNGNMGNSIPMSGPMPAPNGAIPMPAPPGMGSRSTGPIYSSQMNVNEIPRRSGAMVEEPYTLTMRSPDSTFSIEIFIQPDEEFIRNMNGLNLPIYGTLQNENYVDGQIYLNAANGRINLMNYLDDPERYKQTFDQWYRNQLGNDYSKIGSLVNAYKYILYVIYKQGRQAQFWPVFNQAIALA